jgi:peptidoglycan LD-endopeptidase CwlK
MPRDTDISHLHPSIRNLLPELDRQLAAAGIPLQLYEAARSPFRQAELYAVGRDTGTPGHHVTRAMAWSSFHQFGLAVDYVFKIDGNWSWPNADDPRWKTYQQIGTDLGLRSLSFETPHLEMPELLTSMQAGQYPDGGDDSWEQWLESQIELWGPTAKLVGSITHPGAPPLMVERPAVA